MDIGNKYLRSWLRFESATKDFIADNQWQVYGNPTISATNAISGKALQLDGNSYLKLSGVELAGRPFTIDCVAYVDASSPSNARLFNIITTSGIWALSVRKSSSNGNRLQLWFNSYADCSQDMGNLLNSTVNSTGSRVHVALVYSPVNSNLSSLYLCVNGVVAEATSPPNYNRGTFDITVGASPYSSAQGLIGSIDEFRIYDGVALWTTGSGFTPPDASLYNTHEFWTDTIRMPSIPASKWRYENIGEIDTLINTTTAVQLTGLPTTQSKTEKAFYQTTQTKIFDVASSKEVWVKFDVYFDGVNRWRAYDISTGSGNVTGITAQTDGRISLFNRNTSKRDYPLTNEAKINILQTVILHMIADSSKGLIEVYTDDEGFLYAYTGEVNNGTNFSNLYLQSDGAGTFFSNVVISNSPLWFGDDAHDIFLFDTMRMPHVPASEWRYENAGDTSDLNTTSAVQLTNLPVTQSRTGRAFYQTTKDTKLFDIAATAEIWIKFDIYNTTAQWYVINDREYKDGGYNTGLTFVPYTNKTSLGIYDGTSRNRTEIDVTEFSGNLRSVVLHMRAGSTDGLIEVFSDLHGLLYEYAGNVNNGASFSDINMYTWLNPSNGFFSNVLISNNPLWFDDNASGVNVDFLVDTQRRVLQSLTLLFDTERVVNESTIPVVLFVDTERKRVVSALDFFDTERHPANRVAFSLDTSRIVRGVSVQVSLLLDAEVNIVVGVVGLLDTEVNILVTAILNADTERDIYVTARFFCDVWRKIPHKITDVYIPPTPPEPSPGVVPPADRSAFLQSCTIGLNEQQLTDSITFVFSGQCEIMDAVDFQLLDYSLRGRIEETTTKGVMTSCKCTVDIDAILYQQLAYSVPESKWEYTEEYIDYVHSKGGSIVTDPGYEDAKLKATPSAPASAHITEIAAKLGKSVSLHFTDFISTMNTDVKSGTNYAGLLQELFGWTSRIPHLMINCYIRGNTIYVVQRGQEQNTVTLDGQKLTVHTVNKKLVRTTWGSDPWSKTEVRPYFNDWTEGVFEPMQDEGGEGGTEYNDDGLVEETTVQHGDETVVTHYYYKTLANGQKFLHQEVATTYSKGSVVDEVTTTHDPVRNTQSHVYSTDADGVLGGVVTSSNNDDRVTPWAQSQGAASFGAQVYTDNEGNSYIWKGVIYHSDKGEMARRTINGVALIDTSFPVEGESFLQALTNQIMWLDRRTEETITVEVFDYPHLIDFNDKIIFHGNTYHLRSNTATINEKDVNRQSLEFVRWY